MESLCTNHAYPIKHLYKDCELLKRLLRQTDVPNEEECEEAAAKKRGIADKDPDDFRLK